jgi:superfamily I DNA/RNA helicase
MGARPSSFVQEAPVARVREDREWSAQQVRIFEWFNDAPAPSPHLIVRARAGTGKTTTLLEGVNRAPESSILVCAFNKRIATTLNERLINPNAEAKTLHSLGYQAIRRTWGAIAVAQGSTRGDWLTNQVCGKDVPTPIKRLITQLHTKARDMVPTTCSKEHLLALAFQFDYMPDEGWRQYPVEYIVDRAYAAIDLASQEYPDARVGIDFADMIFLPLVHGLLTKDYDLVVVDEAQDLTVAQLTIAQRVCSGRLCLVGDDRQAIYGFRGADSDSLDRLKAELGASELPLTTTYRCGQSIVREAQKLVPDIFAHETNGEGIVDTVDYETLLSTVQPGDFVLSRINAPLVSLTINLLKRGVRATMLGRDIAAGIQGVLKRLRQTSIQDMLASLEDWEAKTSTRLANYGQIALVDRCHDQADMIRSIAQASSSVKDLQARIDWLFSDEEAADGTGQVICSSVHKAKGQEASRVWMLSESFYRRGVSQDEHNLWYVATTRAKHHLTRVSGVPSLAR